MSSNLKVNTILPSVGSNIGLGTGGGNLNVDGGCKVQVGTALTLGHSVGVQFATQNLHSAGFEVNNINASGISTFNEIKLSDTKKIQLGNSDDLSIYHNSGINYIDASAGHFALRGTGNDNILYYTSSGDVEIYHDGAKKFETSSTGVTITGTLTATTFSGSGASLTNLPAANITGTLPAISGANLTGVLKNIVEDTSPQLGGNLDTNTHNILLNDSNGSTTNRIVLGTASDMQIFHDTSHSIIRDSGTGNLMLQSNQIVMESADGGETMATFTDDGDVQLRWNNAIKLYTNANGVNVDKCLQAGSVQTPIESSITHHQSHDPAAIFYPEGGYGNNNSPSNQRQAVIIGSTTGNWVDGHSGNTRGIGLKFSRIVNSAEQIRAGIQHDINSTEKFKFHTSYGDIHFRTRNGNNGNQTWEECDRDPLVLHHNGHVSMCNMPRTIWQVQQSSSSYSGNTTEYTYTGGSATDSNGMSTNTGNGTVTVPYTGVYQICLNIGLHSNSSTNQRLNLKINGSNYQRTESTEVGWCTHTISHCILLAANDSLTFTCVGRTDGGDYSKMSVVMLHGTLTS
tara:strand:- start:1886 stop:3595 length:1710 start_codon:yes stop_codon:yes gene_type:complete